MNLPLLELQPSQLYLNHKKLEDLQDFDPKLAGPLPIQKLGETIFLTDGHHRAYLYYKQGYQELPVYWDTDELDLDFYGYIITNWCLEENIKTIIDLENRKLADVDYQKLWIERCQKLNFSASLNFSS